MSGPLLAERAGVEDRLRLAALRLKAKQLAASRAFDPLLGDTFEAATARKAACRDDLGAYGEFVAGLRPEPHHRLWIDAVTAVVERRVPQHRVLILSPPGMGKSVWISQLFPPWYLGRHPDHCLLFTTSSEPTAYHLGGTVRDALVNSDSHRAVFPERPCRPNGRRGWSMDGLYLRGAPQFSKDPSYRPVGFGQTVMGARVDGVILDDPQDQDEAQSSVEQARARAYFLDTLARRPKPETGWMLCISTRWHERDLPGFFLELAEQTGDWLVIATPMVAREPAPGLPPDPLGREPGQLLWPSYYSAEQVARDRAEMPTAEFNLVMQLDPTGIGGEVYRSESWFRPLPVGFNEPGRDGEPSFREKLFVIQAWDLAFSERDTACYTACCTVGVDREGNLYILNVYRERLTALGVEKAIWEQKARWHADRVVLEESAFRARVVVAIAHAVRQRGPIAIAVAAPGLDKVARQHLPSNLAEAGKVYADREAPWFPSFLAEALGFPRTAFKDMVDAWGLAAYDASRLAERPRVWYGRLNPDGDRGRRAFHLRRPVAVGGGGAGGL